MTLCIYAHAPLHLSILWIPFYHVNPKLTGSLGIGFVLEPGIAAVACQASKGRIESNYRLETVHYALETLGWHGDANIVIRFSAPPGYGLGVSGVAALASSLAYAMLKGKSSLEAADAAHVADVTAKCGLGDVTAVYTAYGLAIRVRPGSPAVGGIAEARIVPELPNHVVICFVKQVETRVLLQQSIDINEAFKLYKVVYDEPNIENLKLVVERFTHKIFAINAHVKQAIESCGRLAELIVYKKGVIAFFTDEVTELTQCLSKLGCCKMIRVYRVAFTPRIETKPIYSLEKFETMGQYGARG